MNRRDWLGAVLGLATALGGPVARGQPTPPLPTEMKALGDDRYQIGRIVIDKQARRFTVPGRVHVTEKPLEFLAATPGGKKEYETLLEVDATGTEFNLACILVGLERARDQMPYQQFSQVPLDGPRVALYVAWVEGGKRRQVPAAEALLEPKAGVKPESVEWVYTGSPFPRHDGILAADITGMLIGFVHDPTTVIEALNGLGIGAYGSVRGNSMLPAVGSSVELIVEVVRATR